MFNLKIQESAENYLETIYMLSRHKPYVRSIDIANELSFSKPSVSVAMKNLRENGYIHMDEQGHQPYRNRTGHCKRHVRTPHHAV